jgi:hypothetical protein
MRDFFRTHKLALLYCLKVFLGVRIALSLVGLLGVALLPANDHAGLPGWELIEGPGWNNLFTAWERWDALWFLQIATDGYSTTDFSAAFFPLYPLLIRWTSPLVGAHPLAAALVISNLAYFGAMFVFYELTRFEFDEQMARLSVVCLAVFPTSYFFVAPYSESLFLLLAVTSLYAARRQRWEIAGTCAALASATRSIGLALALPLAVEALMQFQAARAEREPGRGKRLAVALFWSAFTATGTAVYLYYWYRTNGDALTPLNDQNGWQRMFSWPWETLRDGTRIAFQFIGQYSGGYHTLDWIFVVFSLAVTAWAAIKMRPMYVLYVLAGTAVPLFLAFAGRPFMSLPRFLIVLFPIYWAMARFALRFKAEPLVIGVSAGGLGMMTLLFVSWYWVF